MDPRRPLGQFRDGGTGAAAARRSARLSAAGSYAVHADLWRHRDRQDHRQIAARSSAGLRSRHGDYASARGRLSDAAQPDEDQFYDELFRALGAPSRSGDRIAGTRRHCRELLRAMGTRVLIIDEVHAMLAGTYRQQRIFLNTIRFLANDLRMPLVCAGTDEARQAI